MPNPIRPQTRRRLLAGLILLAAADAAAQAPAPREDEPVRLSPVRVTADLWETPLADIPASVTVFDAAALRAGAVRHFGDLVDQVPNLTWTGGTSRPRYLQIRGVGENSQFEGETPDSAVRFLVDDFDLTGLGTVASAFDVAQVEVLRGPQAGAFGANAAGGLVRLVTNAPTAHWTGQAEATVGTDGLRSAGLAFGGPLVAAAPDRLMMRLALQRSEEEGFRRNLTLNRDTNARDELAGRLRLTWNPSAAWRWDAALLAADFDNGYDEFALDNNGENTFSDQPGFDLQRTLAASLRGAWRGADGLRFGTVSGVARTRSRYAYDDDWTAASYMGFSDLHRTRWVVNQEFRLEGERAPADGAGVDRWTVGAFYSDTDEVSRYTNDNPWGHAELRTEYRAKNTALFGQAGLRLSPRTRVVLGVRAERLEMDGAGRVSEIDLTTGLPEPVVSVRPALSDSLFGGKLTLEHSLPGGELAFVSVTRGYKAGGINVDARIDPLADPLTYETETLWNFEAGVRGAWAGDRLTGEVTVFDLERRDTQVRDSAGFGGSYRFFTDNGEDARVYGLEAAGAYALTDAWSFRGSLALLRSRLDPFVLANGNPGGGRELANAPEYGYTFGVRYAGPRGWFFNTDLVGRARQHDSNNQSEARRAFRVVNASFGYAGARWSVTAWARNLLDEAYDKRVYFFGNEDPDYLPARYEDRADPRQVGVTASYRF